MKFLDALGNTFAWAEANHKTNQILRTKTDEEGNFDFAVPRPGVWTVYAYGHAGSYNAFWGGIVGNALIIEAGSAYTVKLSSPETACLVIE